MITPLIRTLTGAAVLCSAAAALATPPARLVRFSRDVPQPIFVTAPPGDSERIIAASRPGVIYALDAQSGGADPVRVLDIADRVSTENDNGLLGLAFDPAFATTGFLYINYNSLDGFVNLVRYHIDRTDGAFIAEPQSAAVIWRYPRPLGHNGGWIGFSPTNGYLYITSGDGDTGATPDFAGHAQSLTGERLGKVLRIDPSSDDFPADPDRNYHVPASNPFVNLAGDDEIWSYGVRNPWRASFDRTTGDFYFGDVGNGSWEEIDVEPAAGPGGRNYGWPCMEGNHCLGPTQCDCNNPALIPPVWEGSHPSVASITGGYVYRGAAIPEFAGLYFFGDFVRSKYFSFRFVGGQAAELTERTAQFIPAGETRPAPLVASFGEDTAGELYLCSIYTGTIYKLVPYPCLPVVDVQPLPQSQAETTTLQLRVMGAGADPLTFQWFKGVQPLADDARIQGSLTPTLTITQAGIADSGDYSVVLTSPCGSTPSDPVAVTVYVCIHADFNQSGTLTVQDIFDFLNGWFAAVPAADFNQSGVLDVQDIFDYLNAWFAGCP
ncbi:MAG TPA: PQQ-dependent sugar dehydrogenase [Phycisphaerales bacterium]|nr:PQQ-dependent sugar dehydrogenase [Phycisphaerales bacterium]